jgi:hypothetical protein
MFWSECVSAGGGVWWFQGRQLFQKVITTLELSEGEPNARRGHTISCNVHANKTTSDLSLQHISRLAHHIFNSWRDGRFGRAPVGYRVHPAGFNQQNSDDPNLVAAGGWFLTTGGLPLEGSFWTF